MQSASNPSIVRLDSGQRTSRVVIHNGTIYLGGQVTRTKLGGSFAEQMWEALGEVDLLLAKAGSDKRKILRATIYLSDVADFVEMNRLWVGSSRVDLQACKLEYSIVSPK